MSVRRSAPGATPTGSGGAHVGDLDQRARARVALAEEQEVVGLLLRQHREVGLHEAGGEPGGDAREPARARMSARISFGWRASIGMVAPIGLLEVPEPGPEIGVGEHVRASRRAARAASPRSPGARMLAHASPGSPRRCAARRSRCSSWKRRLSEDAGSSSKTSMPARAGSCRSRARPRSASSSWVLPRDVLRRSRRPSSGPPRRASIMWCVSLVCGVWQVTTSASRSTEAMSASARPRGCAARRPARTCRSRSRACRARAAVLRHPPADIADPDDAERLAVHLEACLPSAPCPSRPCGCAGPPPPPAWRRPA